MNGPEWAFPVVQSLHFIGFAFSVGTIAIVDLRLLGLGMRHQSAAELADDLDGVSPLAAKFAGGLWLLLWTAVVAGGRMIAFV